MTVNGYVIKRGDLFVGTPPSGKTFGGIEWATIYRTREKAERNACENESVVAVADVLKGRRM